MTDWDLLLNNFILYLQLEGSKPKNTVDAYKRDVQKLIIFFNENNYNSINEINTNILNTFIYKISEELSSSKSISRVISGIRSFFNFLVTENALNENPATLLSLPKVTRYLPEFLTISEIENLINSIDLSDQNGERNKAIIEVLYGCGLRVSELVNMTFDNINYNEKYLKIIGKGNKERIVPIGNYAINQLARYIEGVRNLNKVRKNFENIIFINNRGEKLSRAMIFEIIKQSALKAGIKKRVSPHTLRHSFATHLVENGADIRVVQEMLGHASIITTEIYTHINTKTLYNSIIKYHPRSKYIKNNN